MLEGYMCVKVFWQSIEESWIPFFFFFPQRIKDEVWGRLNALVYIYKVELDFFYYLKGCCKVPSESQDELLISHIDIISGYC